MEESTPFSSKSVVVLRDQECSKLFIGDTSGVCSFTVNLADISVVIFVIGALMIEGTEKKQLSEGFLALNNWSEFKCRCVYGAGADWKDLKFNDAIPLDLILDCRISASEASFGGFGADGHVWVEYTFENPSMIGVFTID